MWTGMIIVLIVGVSGGYVLRLGTEPTKTVTRTVTPTVAPQPTGLASEEVRTILEDRVAALNNADTKALAAFYAPNAVLEEWDLGPPPNITEGSENIAKRLAHFARNGFAVNNEGLALGAEPWAVQGATWGIGGYGISGFLVYQFNRDLKIVHQWVF